MLSNFNGTNNRYLEIFQSQFSIVKIIFCLFYDDNLLTIQNHDLQCEPSIGQIFVKQQPWWPRWKPPAPPDVLHQNEGNDGAEQIPEHCGRLV